ncbi:MAG: aldo/keto reductase [Chloroflexi bacterium]|nr:aldo/keto reductase [Chloroflexota bacterium]MCY3937333.1 aldo/keto reductase [Chloroflexota bacterium]
MTEALPTVPKVTLGRSGIESTKIGLGTANWIGRTSDGNLLSIMREAFRLGIRHLDTAPSYEQERLARLLREADPPDDLVVITKVGRLRNAAGEIEFDFDPDPAERTVELNLRQLEMEKLPIVLLHDCTDEDLPYILSKGGVLERLRKLQSQGIIEAVGVATGQRQAVALAAESGEFDIIQSYHLYTLLNRVATERIFPAVRKHNLGVVNLSPFAGNVLATGAIEGAVYSYLPASEPVLHEVGRMERECAAKGVSLPIAALTFSLLCQDVDVTVIGPVSIKELREDVAALNPALTEDELLAIASKTNHHNYWG